MTVVSLPSTQPIAGTYWQWQDHSIYYVHAGQRHSNAPSLLLIHGFGASTDHWRKTIADLQDTFDVWAIDLLGFGRSAKPNLTYSAALWQEQLQQFIQTVIRQPTVLVGNSLGGYASLCVAANHPESVRGLVLLNSAGPFSSQQPDTINPPQQGWTALLQKMFQQSWVSFLLFQYLRQKRVIHKTLQKVYVNQTEVTDQLVEEIYRPSCDPGAADVFASIFRNPSGEKVDHLLQKLACPLLMLWGEGDPWINARSRGEKFRQFYPTLTEYYLNSGHCPHDDSPQEVNALLREWLTGLSV